MIDIRQTPEYASCLQKIGWIVERKEEINYFVRKIPVLKGVLKIQRPEKIDLKTIDKIGRKYGVFQNSFKDMFSCLYILHSCCINIKTSLSIFQE